MTLTNGASFNPWRYSYTSPSLFEELVSFYSLEQLCWLIKRKHRPKRTSTTLNPMRVDRFDAMASNVSISPAVAPNYNSDVDWCRVRREEEGIDTIDSCPCSCSCSFLYSFLRNVLHCLRLPQAGLLKQVPQEQLSEYYECHRTS